MDLGYNMQEEDAGDCNNVFQGSNRQQVLSGTLTDIWIGASNKGLHCCFCFSFCL